MSKLETQLRSSHPPEATWEVLKTPVWELLSSSIYPRLSVAYICLDSLTGLLHQDSRMIIRPATRRHRQLAQNLHIPGSVSMRITELADYCRKDEFTENEIISGSMERRVEAGTNDNSVLHVSANFTFKGITKQLVDFLQATGRSPAQSIFESNQRLLDLTPQILADHADTQSQRQSLVSNSA